MAGTHSCSVSAGLALTGSALATATATATPLPLPLPLPLRAARRCASRLCTSLASKATPKPSQLSAQAWGGKPTPKPSQLSASQSWPSQHQAGGWPVSPFLPFFSRGQDRTPRRLSAQGGAGLAHEDRTPRLSCPRGGWAHTHEASAGDTRRRRHHVSDKGGQDKDKDKDKKAAAHSGSLR